MRFIDGAVHVPSLSLLCVADLHIGYEAELRSKGAHIPSSENSVLVRRIARIIACTDPDIVVLNGDVKHAFGRIHDSEWRQLKTVVDVLGDRQIVVVTGNHDVALDPLAKKYALALLPWYQQEDVLFLHGDTLPPPAIDLEAISTIVIGHEHPAISLTSGPRTEIVKCYLDGTWKDTRLIVLPSMFSLTEGSDVLSEKPHSPFLDQDISEFKVYVLSEGEVLPFGTVKDVKNLR